MKKIIKTSYLNFILFCLSLAISTSSSADYLTITCPEPSMLIKVKGNLWSTSIPETSTQNGHPVSEITLTGRVDEKYKDNLTFHLNTGLAYGISNGQPFLMCYYDTQYSGNYQAGNGIDIALFGKLDPDLNLFKYFYYSECKLGENNDILCSNSR